MGEAEYFRETVKLDTCLDNSPPDVSRSNWYGLQGYGNSCTGEQQNSPVRDHSE